MTEVWYGPNVAGDLLGLAQRPDEWPTARAACSTLQLYIQHILSHAPGEMEVGPNCFAALRDAGVFRLLPLAVEGGAVKPWSRDGVAALDGWRQALERLDGIGVHPGAVLLDEPLGARKDCQLAPHELYAAAARVVVGVRALGVETVGLVEPWPACTASEILHEIEALRERGAMPSCLHLDVDRYAIRDSRMDSAAVERQLRTLRDTCRHDYRLPFGVIVFGQRAYDDHDYARSAYAWASQLQRDLGGLPDRLIVQSWELARDGTRTQPHDLPESDPSSHTGIVANLARSLPRG